MSEGMGGLGPRLSKRCCGIFQNSSRSELGTGARTRERHQRIGEKHQDSASDFQQVDVDWVRCPSLAEISQLARQCISATGNAVQTVDRHPDSADARPLKHPSAVREEVGGIQNNCNHGVLLQGVHEILLPANPKLGCCHGTLLGFSSRRKLIA